MQAAAEKTQSKLDRALNTTMVSASVVIVVTGLLHGWNYAESNGLNPFGSGGKADYKTEARPQKQINLTSAKKAEAATVAPYIIATAQAAEPLPVQNNQAAVQVISAPAQRKAASVATTKPAKQQTVKASKPVQISANKRDLERLSHTRTASKAVKPTHQVSAPKQSMQQILEGMTTAKPRVNGMDAISSLTAANRSVMHGKGTPRTDSKQGAIPATNQQLTRDVKSKVEPATKQSNQTKLTIAGVLETAKPAVTRQEATNTKQAEYNDNLMTNAGTNTTQERVEAAKRLAALKVKAAKQAKALRALRAKREADKQANDDQQWSEYLAAKRAKRAAIAAKKEREQAWIAHVEAKRMARKAAQAKAEREQEAKERANEAWEQHLAAKRAARKQAASKPVTRKAVEHSKKPVNKKRKAVIHSEGVKKRDAVTVCIISPVTNQEKCI